VKTAEILAGRLVAWKVREFCSDAVFHGYDIRWKENRGWIESRFLITGKDEDVDDLYTQIMNIFNDEVSDFASKTSHKNDPGDGCFCFCLLLALIGAILLGAISYA